MLMLLVCFSSISLCLCYTVSFCTWVWPLLAVFRWVQIHRSQSPWHFCTSFPMLPMCRSNSGDIMFLLNSSSSNILWHVALFIYLLMFLCWGGYTTNVLRRPSQTNADRLPIPPSRVFSRSQICDSKTILEFKHTFITFIRKIFCDFSPIKVGILGMCTQQKKIISRQQVSKPGSTYSGMH